MFDPLYLWLPSPPCCPSLFVNHRPAITAHLRPQKSINWARCGDRLNMFVLHFFVPAITISSTGEEVYQNKFPVITACDGDVDALQYPPLASLASLHLIGIWFQRVLRVLSADHRKHKLSNTRFPSTWIINGNDFELDLVIMQLHYECWCAECQWNLKMELKCEAREEKRNCLHLSGPRRREHLIMKEYPR